MVVNSYFSIDSEGSWAVIKGDKDFVWIIKMSVNSFECALSEGGAIEKADSIAWALSTNVSWWSPGNAAWTQHCYIFHCTCEERDFR